MSERSRETVKEMKDAPARKEEKELREREVKTLERIATSLENIEAHITRAVPQVEK